MLFFEGYSTEPFLTRKVPFLNAALCIATVLHIEGQRLQATVASVTLTVQI